MKTARPLFDFLDSAAEDIVYCRDMAKAKKLTPTIIEAAAKTLIAAGQRLQRELKKAKP